jgi:hypothetical protein
MKMFVYIDESGDAGNKFQSGSTRCFVMTMLLVDDPIPLQAAVDQLRNSLNYPPSVEFHFAKSSNAIREQFLRAIEPSRFDVRAVITDKQLMLPPQLQTQETFYRYLIRLGLAYNREAIRDASLILDESVQSKRAKHDFRVALRKALNTDPARPAVKNITYHRSHSDNLIQATDMICGAIFAAFERNDPRYRQIIRRHIRDEWFLHADVAQIDGPST